jgi:hypothetical protein
MKKIIISLGLLMTMSFTTKENQNNWELYEAISDVEDYIEWLNEDLYSGNITEEYHEVMLDNYQETLRHLRNVELELANQ